MARRNKFDAEVALYEQERQRVYEKINEMKSSSDFNAQLTDFRAMVEKNPLIASVFINSMYSLLPSSRKRDVEALGVLIDRLHDLIGAEPAILASASVSDALRQVVANLEEINFLNADCLGILAAFAKPSQSFVNRVNASQPRLFDEMKAAAGLFDSWAKNPALYRNKAAFKRDILAKELCLDGGTADRWLKSFLHEIEPDSLIAIKLSKK